MRTDDTFVKEGREDQHPKGSQSIVPESDNDAQSYLFFSCTTNHRNNNCKVLWLKAWVKRSLL